MASLRGGKTSGTEEIRLRQLLSQLMPRIRHRGSSMKQDWEDFSQNSNITRPQFHQILQHYDVPFRQGDIDIIWANIGVQGPSMGYTDFARFCSLQELDPSLVSQPQYDEPPPASRSGGRSTSQPRGGVSLFTILMQNRRRFAIYLLESDPNVDGYSDSTEVAAAIRALGPTTEPEIERLLGNYDPLGTGNLNYFSLLADICTQAAAGQPPVAQPRAAPRPIPGALPGARPAVVPPPARSTVTFADDEDDSPPVRRGPSQERLQALVGQLSREVTKAYESGQTAWHRWRGGNQTLMAEDFARNANQVCHMDMTVDEAQALIGMMGGALSLGKFVQLLGSGNVSTIQVQAVKDAADEDPNDKWLIHCARQIAAHPGKSEKWEYILTHCPNIEMGLAQLKRVCDVIVDPNEFRPVWRSLGPEETIMRIRRFVAACG